MEKHTAESKGKVEKILDFFFFVIKASILKIIDRVILEFRPAIAYWGLTRIIHAYNSI
jgi:hypothetical protein